MNQASAGDPGVCPQSSGHTSVSTGVSSTHRIPELRSKELRESSNREGELRNQDGWDLRADTREESPSPPPAPKGLKRDTKKKERKQKVDEEGAQKMKLLTSSLSEAQLNHYEAYCRSAFPGAAVKHLIQRAAGTSVAKNVVIAMAGLAKVFVGEVVEEALDVCGRWGETPPLQPRHLREAVRRLGSKGKVPNTKSKKILFF